MESLDGLLLLSDEIEQLFDRDSPVQRVSAKLSEIDTDVQNAHDHQRQFLPLRRRGAGMAKPKSVEGWSGIAPTFRFEWCGAQQFGTLGRSQGALSRCVIQWR